MKTLRQQTHRINTKKRCKIIRKKKNNKEGPKGVGVFQETEIAAEASLSFCFSV